MNKTYCTFLWVVILTKLCKMIGSTYQMRGSRLVEFKLLEADEQLPYIIVDKRFLDSKDPCQLLLMDSFGRETQTGFTFNQFKTEQI